MFPFPSEVEVVLKEFRTCEFTTLARDGSPMTWPVTALYDQKQGRFLTCTSIGLPQKAFNIRRNPRVSLLFSNPTGSGLSQPPAVLVQGEARVSENIDVSPLANEELRKCWLHIMRFQPFSPIYGNDPLSHFLYDWYFMRLVISVTPRRLCWWDHGDFTQAPHEMEINHAQ